MSYFRQARLRIVEFNVENLFVRLDHYQGQDLATTSERDWQKLSTSIQPNKPLYQVERLASNIKAMDPDLLMLCEVGGVESLENFSRLFLANRYAAHLIEGNSDRGIDIGYLVKKSLPFKYDLISHKNREIDFLYPHEKTSKETGYAPQLISHRFSRDVLELRVFEVDSNEPVLILLLVHLKSQLDRDRIDPGGRDRRKAELEKLVKIYREIDQDFGSRVPILLGGDFNGRAGQPTPDAEFEAIYRDTNLQDAFEIAKRPTADRFTYMQLYNNNRVGIERQLDYIFLPHSIAHRVNARETYPYRFIDEMGLAMDIPRNLNEKRLLPSDHYPVILTLDPDQP